MRALPTISVVFITNAPGNPSRVVDQVRGLLDGKVRVDAEGVDSKPDMKIATKALISEQRPLSPSGVLLLEPAAFEVLPPGSTQVLRVTKSSVRLRASLDFTNHCFAMSADRDRLHTVDPVLTGVGELARIVDQITSPGVPFPILARLLMHRGLARSGREMSVADLEQYFVVLPMIDALGLGSVPGIIPNSRTGAPVGPDGMSPYEGLVSRSKGLANWKMVRSGASLAAKHLANSGLAEVVRGARQYESMTTGSAPRIVVFETNHRTVLRDGATNALPNRLGEYFGENDDTGKWPEIARPIASRAIAALDAMVPMARETVSPSASQAPGLPADRTVSRGGPAEEVAISA